MHKDQILNELRPVLDSITRYTETAEVDLFLRCYVNSPDFTAVSADGIIRNYADFEKIAKEYYGSVIRQKVATLHEIIHILDEFTAVFCWSGNIDAFFKNGDLMIMKNYSVTFLFKKIRGEWKVIHSHESVLPPQIVKSK
jgi:predicted PilT family ATPase